MPGVVSFVSGDVPGTNRRLWFNNPEELLAEEEVQKEKFHSIIITFLLKNDVNVFKFKLRLTYIFYIFCSLNLTFSFQTEI